MVYGLWSMVYGLWSTVYGLCTSLYSPSRPIRDNQAVLHAWSIVFIRLVYRLCTPHVPRRRLNAPGGLYVRLAADAVLRACRLAGRCAAGAGRLVRRVLVTGA
jgi:hypothetical protein